MAKSRRGGFITRGSREEPQDLPSEHGAQPASGPTYDSTVLQAMYPPIHEAPRRADSIRSCHRISLPLKLGTMLRRGLEESGRVGTQKATASCGASRGSGRWWEHCPWRSRDHLFPQAQYGFGSAFPIAHFSFEPLHSILSPDRYHALEYKVRTDYDALQRWDGEWMLEEDLWRLPSEARARLRAPFLLFTTSYLTTSVRVRDKVEVLQA